MAKTQTRRKQFFRDWRKARGLTQEEVADRIGMSNSNLSMLERGRVDYTAKTLEALADAYGCTPADLLSRRPEDAEDELTLVARDLSPEQRDQVAKIAKTFLN